MAIDNCRDCEEPISGVPDEFDGRCTRCHKALLARQKETRKPAKEAPADAGEE